MNKNVALSFKWILSAVVALAYAANVSAQRPADRASDHLVFTSMNGLDARYEQLLAQKLFETPSDFGRAVVRPPFEGERALSIYSLDGNADLAALVLAKAERNIWRAAADLDHDLRVSPRVRITSAKATMKRRVALVVAEAIGHAIAGTQPLASTEAVPVDGTSIVFFAPAQAKTKVRSALLDPIAEGKLSQALRRLVVLLEKYCTSSSATRHQLSKEIEEQARVIKGMQ
jgi:hypothetical protein